MPFNRGNERIFDCSVSTVNAVIRGGGGGETTLRNIFSSHSNMNSNLHSKIDLDNPMALG